MKCSRVIVPAAFLATLLLSARLPGDSARFAPAAGAGFAKTFSVQGTLALDDLVAYVNGEEQDPSMMGMPDDFTVDFGYEMEVTDTFAAVADGRPTDFTRAFESFRAWSESSDGESSEDGMDELTGKTARFLWDEEEGEYARSFVDDTDADPADLELVATDMDLRVLLPPSEVEEGDEWSVTGLPVLLTLAPGLDLERAFQERPDDLFEGMPAEVVDSVAKSLAGLEAVCTWRGTADQDGVTVGIIEFSCEIDQSVSIDPSVMGGEESGMEMEGGGFEVAVELEIKGECAWDMEAGHFASFDAESNGTIGVEMSMSVPDMFELEANAELSLELGHSFRAAAE